MVIKKATMEGQILVRGQTPETKITALVVDDNMINQTLHRRLLLSLGVENMVVGNGKEAVDVHCSGKSFDLILMDLDMPIMNGIEVSDNTFFFFYMNFLLLCRYLVVYEI